MTIETFVINAMNEALPVFCYGSEPSPMPDSFVTVEQTGSRITDRLKSATLVVQSWAPSRAEAMALNETVEAAMAALVERPEISRCALNTSYNYPDEERKRPRYQAVFDIVHYL